MIISENQIMGLIKVAEEYLSLLREIEHNNIHYDYLYNNKETVHNLLGQISGQQSEELKEIK